jgi:hypothetical protein
MPTDYIGLNTSRVIVVRSETAIAKLAVMRVNSIESKYDLEPYNADILSFIPLERDQILARGMFEWGYHKVGILEFQRDDTGHVVALWWQLDEHDYPGLWVRGIDGIVEQDVKRVIEKFDRFRKPETSSDDQLVTSSFVFGWIPGTKFLSCCLV